MVVTQPGVTLSDEAKIPQLAGLALRQAYERALLLGGSVITADHGRLMEVRADGVRREIGTVPSPIAVTPGTKLVRKTAR